MDAEYPTRFRDRHGELVTVICNDGKTLGMIVRGVEFRARDFDGFTPVDANVPTAGASITLHHGSLCACEIAFEMPLASTVRGAVTEGVLSVRLDLGDPRPPPRDGLDREALALSLAIDGHAYQSAGTSGWFELELLDLDRQLPADVSLRACVTCAFSDYSPYGHGLFGDLACFRGNKAGYLASEGKRGILDVWGTMTEFVQETYLCPEFERRMPGTGYRG